MSKTHHWEKEGYLWMKIDDNKRSYIDIIFNTCTKIVEDNDTSQWALYSWMECCCLLWDHKRWPDQGNSPDEAPNRWLWYPYKWIVKKNRKWSRPQNDMTRDSCYAFGDCYVHLHGHYGELMDRFMANLFHSTKLPWYAWRPNYSLWKRRLRSTNSKHFVKRLRSIADRATHTWFEKNYEDDFYKNI